MEGEIFTFKKKRKITPAYLRKSLTYSYIESTLKNQ
jgi:hypothetical protein